MKCYQYLGDEPTKIRVEHGKDKQKVVKWEIVKSDIDSTYFTANGFQIVEEKVSPKKK